jgi:hypothetical protein
MRVSCHGAQGYERSTEPQPEQEHYMATTTPKAQDKRFSPRGLYDVYTVTIQVRDRLCGGFPRNKDMIGGWVKATTGYDDEQSVKLTAENVDLVVNEVAEKSWIGFMATEEKGLFIQARQIKACLKQSASVLGITKTKRGSKQILAEGLEVKAVDGGDRFYFGVKAPSGTLENAIHVMTAQGPRTALRRMDYIDKPEITFEVWILKTAPQETRHVGEDDLIEILKHAQENGLGASRSQGEGKFDVVTFTKADEAKK